MRVQWRKIIIIGATCVVMACAHRAGAANYFVSVNGSDHANGSSSHPFATIQKGIDAISDPGDTLTILPGTYREELTLKAQGTADRPIVIRAARKDKVIVDGADPVKGWKLIDTKHHIWGIDIAGKAPYRNDNGRWDMPPRSEQVFVNDKRCMHVKEGANAAQMPEYSFTATLTDPAHYTLKLPTDVDPNTALTEVTVRQHLLDVSPSSKYVIIDGIHFRRAMNSYQQKLATLGGDHMELRNCIFEYSSAGVGLDIGCSDSRIYGCIFRDNGCLGFAFHGADDLVDHNLITRSDLAGYGGWEAGGTKIVGNGEVIRDNRFIDNLGGVAIWLDVYPGDCVIKGNYVSGNHGEGIRAEIAFHSYIGYNIVENTQPCKVTYFGKTQISPGIGISVQNSAETVVCNNFVKNNRGVGIQLFTYHRPGKMPEWQYNYPDDRHRHWLKQNDDSGYVYAYDNLIYNNVLVRTDPKANDVGIWVRGQLNGDSPQCYGDQVDYNFYWDSVTHAPYVRLGNNPPEVPNPSSQWRTKYAMDRHALGGFSAEDYLHPAFSTKYPYAPTAAFAGIGKGGALSHFKFVGLEAVDYLGHPITSEFMGHIQYGEQ